VPLLLLLLVMLLALVEMDGIGNSSVSYDDGNDDVLHMKCNVYAAINRLRRDRAMRPRNNTRSTCDSARGENRRDGDGDDTVVAVLTRVR
jgi:hypothetical protein